MNILSSLYYDLLSQFPFSITGYEDIEIKMSQYFTSFCDHSINKQNKNISFIVGVFGQLSGLDGADNGSVEKIIDWKTETIRKFLFCNYERDHSALVMSFYIYQLRYLLPGKFAINVLTENFRNDIDFRISLSDDENANFIFHRAEKIFEIQVPKLIYRQELFKNSAKTKNLLRERLQRQLVNVESNNLLVKHDLTDSYELEIIGDEMNTAILSLYEDLGTEIFSKTFDQFYESSREYLSSNFDLGPVKDLIFKNDRVQIEDLLKIAYAGSFLCAFYGVNLEYILSTCRIIRDKSYGLGGLAVGVKKGRTFPLANRAFYKIISNQIAANLSGQITFNLFRSEKYKERASEFIYQLYDNESPLNLLTHPYEKSDFHRLREDALSELDALKIRNIIHKKTFEKAESIINGFSEDYRLKTEGQKELKQLFRMELSDLVENHFPTYFSGAKIILTGKTNDGISYHFDFYWLKAILTQIPFANFLQHVSEPKELTIEITSVDNEGVECANDENRSHYLRIRMSDNGKGMDLEESLSNTSGSYRRLLKGQDDFSILQTHGKVELHSRGKKISLLELHKKDNRLSDSEIMNGTMFEIFLKS